MDTCSVRIHVGVCELAPVAGVVLHGQRVTTLSFLPDVTKMPSNVAST